MSEVLLDVQNLACTIGGVRAVVDVTFDVRSDEIIGIIGPNGAGKTTVFNVVTGYVRGDDGGQVRWLGQSICGMRPQRIADLGMTRTFQDGGGFDDLTVSENLLLASRGRDPEYMEALLDRLGLGVFRERKVRDCSLATRRVVGIAMAIVRRPRLLLLDEPLAGLDLRDRETVVAMIKEVHDDGVAIVVIEHDIERTLALVDRLAVLETGEVVAFGEPSELVHDLGLYMGG